MAVKCGSRYAELFGDLLGAFFGVEQCVKNVFFSVREREFAAKMNVIRATMMTNRRAAVRICVAGYAEDDGSDPAVPSASGVCVSAVSAAGSLKRFDTLLLWVHLSIVKFMLCERYVSAAGCGNCAL